MGPPGGPYPPYHQQQQLQQQQQQLLDQQQQEAAAAAAASAPLTTSSDFGTVVLAMQRAGSGLEVRDRLWLKIKISNAFIGSEVVDWLYENVRREPGGEYVFAAEVIGDYGVPSFVQCCAGFFYFQVEGFTDRRDARRYASQLLKQGLIKHTVDKKTFSEQCYYAFGDDKVLTEGKPVIIPINLGN